MGKIAKSMSAFLISVVNDSSNNIRKISHRFLWSGNSYVPNDTDFCHIEKKEVFGIYAADEYFRLIKNKNHVTLMQKWMFLTLMC